MHFARSTSNSNYSLYLVIELSVMAWKTFDRFWVGYSDLALEGFWKTITNEVPSYLRWIEDQPDNRLENENCALVVMGPWGRGRIMDANCDSSNGNAIF